jgi:hypothetical protein
VRGSNPGKGKQFFSCIKVQTCFVFRSTGFFHGVKRPRRKFNHLPPSRTEVKNVWSHTSNPPIDLYGVGGKNISFYVLECLRVQKNAVGIVICD